MRILHIHSGNLYGGVESVLRTLARCRSMVRGVEPVFALSFDGRIATELRQSGCELHILGPVQASHPLTMVRARARLAALCRASRFDATVAHSAWSLALLGPAATRPLIMYLHDICEGWHWTERWCRFTRPDLVIANSACTAATGRNLHPRVPISVVYPPVELSSRHVSASHRALLRRAHHAVESSLVILQAGRFEPWKGHRLLLESLATLSRNPRWLLWIAGEPQRPAEIALKQDLIALAEHHGIRHRIKFLGHIDDMPALMQAADIYCQPNTAPEPFGLTYIEALHAGIPVIATALGGAREILQPSWGLLAEPSLGSVPNALRLALENDELRLRLAEAGPLRARQLCNPRTQIESLAKAVSLAREEKAAA